MHPWLVQMSIWHYWLIFGFIISMTLYFTFLIKALTYNKADVRIYRSTGEKRRNAWSEILTVIFPFFWSINLISNAFAYLRVLEGNGGYTFLSVQVAAHQWGWKYCYSNAFYFKFWSHPVQIGYNSTYPRSGKGYLPILKSDSTPTKTMVSEVSANFSNDKSESYLNWLSWKHKHILEISYGPWNNLNITLSNLLWPEIYLYRSWLKKVGLLERLKDKEIKNAIFQPSYVVAAQGCEVYAPVKKLFIDRSYTYVQDKLRLFRASGALVLPTRVTLRIMGTSEDITHSWAVPGLGLKLDCVPGRLFCLYINIGRDGIYYGQCSELCGWNHYNMPVVVYALPVEHFILWWETALQSQVIENKIQAKYLISYETSIYKYK
jgi:heme/copper-type cytochrome/quinol oxidase subunit 2